MRLTSTLRSVIAAILVGAGWLSLHAQKPPVVPVGRVTLPRDLEVGIQVLSKGEYDVALFTGRKAGISLGTTTPDSAGFTHSWSTSAEVAETTQAYPEPKIEANVVTEAGACFVEVRVFLEKSVYRSRWKCAGETVARSSLATDPAPVDPQIDTELKLLDAAHTLLDRFAQNIWPGWEGYAGLDFTLVFPNRDVLLVTRNERLPQRYKVLPGRAVGRKPVYIDRTAESQGRIGPSMSMNGHGDIRGVTCRLVGTLEKAPDISPSGRSAEQASPGAEEASARLMRLLLYVHEMYHSFQAWSATERAKSGPAPGTAPARLDFDPTLDYSVYAHIEGQALLNAFTEKDGRKALEYFKDSWVAKTLKERSMPAAMVSGDLVATRDEGLPTYAALRMAMLMREAGYHRRTGAGEQSVSVAFEHLDSRIRQDGVASLEQTAGRTLEVIQRHYIYGAFQCLLLDRFLPQWKNGFLEGGRTLSDMMAQLMKLSDDERKTIESRLRTRYRLAEISVVHERVIKERDEAIEQVLKRTGRKYLIDLREARGRFAANPRSAVQYRDQQLYPHGLTQFVCGSLVLTSEDTPMRFVLSQSTLEWIDTEAKARERGYDLTYGEKVDDVYRNATVTTRGFKMTADAIRIAESEDTVRISIQR